ncbi:Predicted arabinose efflux permease, MFS family [Friedmanniella luteola]|uniref:Predicted arabinose efflux permease, MFS family n=1 Tax=Friedmanniella luteola TaxID=546871 RepID=A0A1H1MG06_9ACTN|nr:MFS transporter [Friedmanniella luteola]SDR85305.1 Predicted arabinose efflux permease, MFS family [Friedmanniella luteola]
MSVETTRSANPDATTRPESPDPTTTEHTAADPAEPDGSRSSDDRPGTPANAGMFAALANRNYRVYVSGSFVSNIGTWMQRVAQDWLVLELSGGSGLAVGITTGLQFLPMLLLSPWGGLVADRFDKRLILKLTQAWLALCAALLGVLAITGVAATWHVFLIAFAFGLGTAFDNPARQAFVSEVAGKEHLANAIGLNSATFNAARIVGPAVAGVVIATFGSGWAILSNAVTYTAFIGALVLIDARTLTISPPAARAKRQIREGLAYVRRRPDLLLVMGTVFFLGTFGLNFQMTSALMAQQEFHKGAQEYGILGTIMAVGSLAGALLAARRRSTPRGRFVVGMALAFGVIEIAAGLMPSYLTYAAILPLLGLAALLTLTAANASVQMTVDSRLRGRVMALYMMVLMGGAPIGAPILGWVGEVFGARWTLIGGGALSTLGVLLCVALLARGQRLHLVPHLHAPHLSVERRAA